MFRTSFPRTAGDLNTCYDLMHSSPYYNDRWSLTRDQVIPAWGKMVREGTGNILCGEYISPSEIKWPLMTSFGTFVTEDYAKRIVQQRTIHVAMDFLHQYYQYHFEGKGADPAPTKEQIEDDNEGHGLYYLGAMTILPDFTLSRTTSQIMGQITRDGYSPDVRGLQQFISDFNHWYRAVSMNILGGYHYNAWFNDVVGAIVKEGFVQHGYNVLRESPNNSLKEPGEQRFLCCVTRDPSIRVRLGITPDQPDTSFGSATFFYEAFGLATPEAGLSELQKKVGRLLVVGKMVKEIETILSRDRDNAPGNRSEESVRNVIVQINRKLKLYETFGSTVTQKMTRDALVTRLHELRSVVIWHLL
jgi:hypothetical protein